MPFIAMEYVIGETLFEKIQGHALDPKATLYIALQIADAFRVDTVRSQVYIRPANVSPRLLAFSGLIFPSLPADKLFPATHQEFTYPIA